MSSIKCSQMMGCVPVHDVSASGSTLPMNKLAKVLFTDLYRYGNTPSALVLSSVKQTF